MSQDRKTSLLSLQTEIGSETSVQGWEDHVGGWKPTCSQESLPSPGSPLSSPLFHEASWA